jgi:predicted  nucleic acid-binding Zn-ribbon protein
MSQAVLLMLDDARAIRERAERVRQLANQVTTQNAVENLLHYAAELEQAALEGERRACELAETISKTRTLSAEIKSLVAETRARIQRSRARVKPQR